MSDIEKRLEAIEKRNLRVEQDKAWETSWTRRISITVFTYIIVAMYLLVVGNDRPFINALVPAVGYFLSTLVLKSVRNFWQK